MIQVMHTVADYMHDARYRMPDRPLPYFIKDFFQNTAFVLARHQKTGMPGFYQRTSRHAYTHCFIIRIDGHLIRFPGGKKFLTIGENG